jgi:hypothetical protein
MKHNEGRKDQPEKSVEDSDIANSVELESPAKTCLPHEWPVADPTDPPTATRYLIHATLNHPKLSIGQLASRYGSKREGVTEEMR